MPALVDLATEAQDEANLVVTEAAGVVIVGTCKYKYRYKYKYKDV
jgi:hypothetical protein